MKKKGRLPLAKDILERCSAFSLLEVLIAVTILTLGLLGVAKMQVTAIKGNYISDKTSVALHLAEEKMEDLLQRAWTDGDVQDDNGGNNNDLTSVTNVDHEELNVQVNGQVGGGAYHRVWNIADPPGSASQDPIPNTKFLCVIVTWGPGERHRVALTSIKHIN